MSRKNSSAKVKEKEAIDVTINSIDPGKILPEKLRIKGADCHPYRIGLSLYKSKSPVKRRLFHNPFVIFIFMLSSIGRNLFYIFTPETTIYYWHTIHDFRLYGGDFGFFMGICVPLNILSLVCHLLVIFSQMINFSNYLNGIKPTDLRVFEMMAGLQAPITCGLKDRNMIYKLVTFCRKLLGFALFIAPLNKYMAFFFVGANYLIKCTFAELVLVVTPHTMVWALSAQNVLGIIIWQFIYYFMIIHYLLLKLKFFNVNLKSLLTYKTRYKSNDLLYLCNEFNAIYSEIAEYNRIYWSKFLGLIWLLMSIIITMSVYLILMPDVNIIVKIFFGFFFIIFTFILLFIIQISASIYKEAMRSYKLFHSLNSAVNHSIPIKFKCLSIMERIAKKRIGFHCWKLFIITRFRGYEMISFIVVLYLKSIEFFG